MTVRTPAVLALFLAATRPLAAIVDVGDVYNTVTLEVETAHVKWAKPLAGGSLRALVIGPRYGMRDLAELGQRLDLSWMTVMTGNHERWEGSSRVRGCTEADALGALDEAVKGDYDLILIGNVRWQILPKPALYEMLKRVRDGAGVVYAPIGEMPALFPQLFDPAPAVSDPGWITRGSALAGITCLQGQPPPVEFCGVLGRGRVVVLRWLGGIGGIHFLTPRQAATCADYEYCQQLLVRACLWAAGRNPDAALQLDLPAELPWDGLGPVRVPLPQRPHRVMIRDAQGREVPGPRESAGRHLTLPGLPLGRHFCDLWVYEDGKVADFLSRTFTVTGPVRIEAITFDKPFVQVGDEVSGTVTLSGAGMPLTGAEVGVFDIFDREVWRQQIPLPAGDDSFSFTWRPAYTTTTKHRVRVRLLIGRRVYAESYADLMVPTRGHPDLEIIGWGGGAGNWLYDQLETQKRRHGFTASIFGGNLNAGIRAVPYTTSYRYKGTSRVCQPCYTNPDDRAREAEKLRKAAQTYLPQGILAYSLGDENTLAVNHVDVCMSPTCQADFREWLKRAYGDVTTLNAEWGTKYERWDEIAPMTLKEAQAHGNLAPFVDHRLHMDEVFAGVHLFAQDVLHETDPLTPVGPEGMWGTHALQGYYWDRMARNLGVMNVYPDEYLKREIVRSLAVRDALTGMWYGSYGHDIETPDEMERLPWMMLLHDQNSIWWYGVSSYSHIGSCMTALAPDLRPVNFFRRTLPEWKLLREGAARLIMSLDRLHDGIAVLYSRPSTYAFGLGTEDMIAAVEDMGLQYDVISDEDLSRAPLSYQEYRVLVLPGCQALSDAETGNIRAFAEAGGVVVADLLAGRYDGHGKLRGTGALDDLFGLASVGTAVRQEQVTADLNKLEFALLRTGECELGDGEVLATLADGRPAIVRRGIGRGAAFYLNFTLEGYRTGRTGSEVPPLGRVLRTLLATAVVKTPVSLIGGDGQALPRCEICRYTDGRMQLIGVLREVGEDSFEVPAIVGFSARSHVYDVRRKRYLGETDQVEAELGPAEVYVVLPYRVAGLSVTALAEVPRGAEVSVTASIRTEGEPPATHVLRFEAVRPDGEVSPRSQNVVTRDGQGAWTWHTPFNAPTGPWTVRVRDATSGETADTVITLN